MRMSFLALTLILLLAPSTYSLAQQSSREPVDIKAVLADGQETDGPVTLEQGGSLLLRWTSRGSNIANLVATGDWSGSKKNSGSQLFDLLSKGSYLFILTSVNLSGKEISSDRIQVFVRNKPSVSISGNLVGGDANGDSLSVPLGSDIDINWKTSDSDVTLALGDWPLNGKEISSSGTYRLSNISEGRKTISVSVSNELGTLISSITIDVTETPPAILVKKFIPIRMTGWFGVPKEVGSIEWRTRAAIVNKTAIGQFINLRFLNSQGKFLPTRVKVSIVDEEFDNAIFGFNYLLGKSSITHHYLHCIACGVSELTDGIVEYEVQAEWSQVERRYIGDVEIQYFLDNLDNEGNLIRSSSVLASEFVVAATIKANSWPNVETGIAIFNPSNQEAQININLFMILASTPDPVANATLKVGPRSQKVLFLSEIFPDLQPDRFGNKLTDGTIEIESSVAIAIVGLNKEKSKTYGDVLTLMPLLSFSRP